MRLRTLLGLALCSAASASAQMTNSPAGTLQLSLRDCIDLALKHNLNLRIEHLTVEMAGDALSIAYGPYDPTLTFGASRDYASDLGTFDPRKFNPYFPVELNDDKLGSDLSGKAPFGLSYDLSGSVLRTHA